jgi:hypothetical protein
MAPPKPTTPDAAAKKKVTPAQVAFLVERYLADSGFHAALAAFRSDAAHLFSPHRAKPPPKGLLPLADILHDYIALKEGRVAVDSAMHAMHSLVSTYYASSSSSSPPMMMMPPLPPPAAAAAAQPSSPPLVPPLLVASSSPPQHQGNRALLPCVSFLVFTSTALPPCVHCRPPPARPIASFLVYFAATATSPIAAAGHPSPAVHHYAHASTALLVQNSSGVPSSQAQQPTKKRKHSKSAGKTATASKKSCIASATTSDAKGTVCLYCVYQFPPTSIAIAHVLVSSLEQKQSINRSSKHSKCCFLMHCQVKLLPLSCRMIPCQRPIQPQLSTLLCQSFLSRTHLLQRAYSGHFSLSSTLLPVHRNRAMPYKIRIRPLLIQLKCHCLCLQLRIPNRTLPPPSAP